MYSYAQVTHNPIFLTVAKNFYLKDDVLQGDGGDVAALTEDEDDEYWEDDEAELEDKMEEVDDETFETHCCPVSLILSDDNCGDTTRAETMITQPV